MPVEASRKQPLVGVGTNVLACTVATHALIEACENFKLTVYSIGHRSERHAGGACRGVNQALMPCKRYVMQSINGV